MPRLHLTLTLALVLASSLVVAWPASAQELPAPRVPEAAPARGCGSISALDPSALDGEALLAERLAAMRCANLEARADEGWVLVGFAAASIAAGLGVALAGWDAHDDRTLWGGIGTASWGGINALFSLMLFDLSGAAERAIDADRGARGADLVRAREEAARAQYSTATLIAVNAGLDVFYVAAGLLLFALGDVSSPGEWSYDTRDGLIGYGAAMAAQGGFLLVYDVVTWLFAQERGDRLLRLDRAPGAR